MDGISRISSSLLSGQLMHVSHEQYISSEVVISRIDPVLTERSTTTVCAGRLAAVIQ